jgi:hypothetical protein
MRTFSDATKKNFLGMSESIGDAVGEIFDGLQLSAQLVEQNFAKSARASEIFQKVQLALVGTFAAIKAVEATGAGLELQGDEGKGSEAALKYASAAAYAVAAGMAGYSVANVGRGGGGRTAADSSITDPDRFAQERKTVIVNIERVTDEEYVRREVIPIINDAVGEDVTLLSTHSQSTDRTDPGRFST